MADEEPKPGNVPGIPTSPQDRTNQKPPSIHVPIPLSSDASDPLDPHRFDFEELTVRQVLQEADRVIAHVRSNYYQEYRGLIGQLGTYFRSYRNESARREYEFRRADLHMRELQSIKLEGLEGLKARDEARKAVGESWFAWWAVYNAFKALAKRYAVLSHIKEDLVSGVKRPPSDPPELV